MTFERGLNWSVIFKDADYSPGHVPAQQGLPIRLGQSEYRILTTNESRLRAYVPRVYWSESVVGQQRYRYLLQDLDWRWYQPILGVELVALSGWLSEFHSALKTELSSSRADLIQYDLAYSTALREYVRTSVERYLARHPTPEIEAAWSLWPILADAHRNASPPGYIDREPIHGDLNTSNVFVHWRSTELVKAIDWEWAGFGYRHTDLSSLLKFASDDVRETALATFATNDSSHPPSLHRSIFAWCRLQDSIRDIGYLAAQFLTLTHQPRIDPGGYIRASLKRANDAYRLLVDTT